MARGTVRSRIAVAGRADPQRSWLAAFALAACLGVAAEAHGQTQTPGTGAPAAPGGAPAVTPDGSNQGAAPAPGGAQTGVLRPPANVDPGMAKTPPPAVNFPTPVVRPPPANGNTVVVPK